MKAALHVLLMLVGIASFAQVAEPLDSINAKLDSLISPPAKLDSTKSIVDDRLDSLQKLNTNFSQALDITNPDFSKYKGRLDSIKARLTHRRDSLKGRGLPADSYTKSIDSLNQIDPLDSWKEQQGKLNSSQTKIQNQIQKPAGVVNEKLGQLSTESGGRGNVPGNLKSPDLPTQQTDLNFPASGKSEIPSLDVPELNPDLALDPDKLKESMQIDHLEKIQDGLGDVSGMTGKAQGYSNDIDNIGTGNLSEVKEIPGDLKSNVPMDGAEAVQQGDLAMADATKQLQTFKNPEAFRKQTVERGKSEVAKQLVMRNPDMEKTVNKVSQYQKRGVSIFKKVKGLPDKKTKNEKLPVIERFVPGFTFQVQKNTYLLIDFNPSIRYRFNTIFSLGAGWVDRIAFEDGSYTSDVRVKGVRTYSELSLIKGFSLRFDAERMNSFVPPTVFQPDQGIRMWRNYYLGGLKKEFNFLTGVSGNVQFMYNFTHKDGTSPYASRFNVRFGFEFPLKNN
ncbi:MAG: hypothetical protein R2804_08605 [Cyclobacteriaceae bacterium]